MDHASDRNGGERSEVTPEMVLAAGIRLHQAGRLDEAEGAYRALLEALPELPEALHFLGILEHDKGDDESALAHIRRAIECAPGYADAHNNLGNILKKKGRREEAAAAYRRAIELRPGDAAAHNNLGVVLKELGQFEAAIEQFQKTIEAVPGNAEFHHNLGNAYLVHGQFGQAAQAYRTAIGLRPYQWEDYESLCRVLYLSGANSEAIPVLRQWLSLDPTNPLALHRWAACAGSEQLPRASDEYVSQTFDQFAGSFDFVLKKLDYRAPFLVRDAVAKLHPTPGGDLDLLDAGCGTGLCSGFLRPYARRLVGVDLSAKMLERARDRSHYDELVHQELTAYIASHRAVFDLIVSTDTLVYFGDLQPVLQAARGALRPLGHLVFTVERTDLEPASGFQLNPHGRFSHSKGYLRDSLMSAGMTPLAIDLAVLRNEGGLPVDGLLVVACAG